MKNDINLIPNEKSPPLSPKRLLMIASIWLGLLMIVGLGMALYAMSIYVQLNNIQVKVEKTQQAYAAIPQSEQINQMLLKRDALKQLLLVILESKKKMEEPKGIQYSSILKGLARSQVAGLWVTAIKAGADESSIKIEGQTKKPEVVITFLKSLSRQPGLSKTRFKIFEIKMLAPDSYHFKVNGEDEV